MTELVDVTVSNTVVQKGVLVRLQSGSLKGDCYENAPSIVGVWYRLEGQKDFQRLGTVFHSVKIIGGYGWVHVDDFSLCFDPTKYIYVWWRDDKGNYHRDGWFPDK